LLQVALDRDGGATIDGSEEYRGFEAAALRASVERLDVQARRQAVEQALSAAPAIVRASTFVPRNRRCSHITWSQGFGMNRPAFNSAFVGQKSDL
jgi:hypothetical protein